MRFYFCLLASQSPDTQLPVNFRFDTATNLSFHFHAIYLSPEVAIKKPQALFFSKITTVMHPIFSCLLGEK